MIESSRNIFDLHISQFVRNIAIAERDMLSILIYLFIYLFIYSFIYLYLKLVQFT